MPKTSVQRIKVWRGQLERTTGGLTKAMLTKNKRGKIVSKKKSAKGSKNAGDASGTKPKLEDADKLDPFELPGESVYRAVGDCLPSGSRSSIRISTAR